jgi:hypothetical protein
MSCSPHLSLAVHSGAQGSTQADQDHTRLWRAHPVLTAEPSGALTKAPTIYLLPPNRLELQEHRAGLLSPPAPSESWEPLVGGSRRSLLCPLGCRARAFSPILGGRVC